MLYKWWEPLVALWSHAMGLQSLIVVGEQSGSISEVEKRRKRKKKEKVEGGITVSKWGFEYAKYDDDYVCMIWSRTVDEPGMGVSKPRGPPSTQKVLVITRMTEPNDFKENVLARSDECCLGLYGGTGVTLCPA
ncbi:predicted protein [Arabidopsis lyrata subsp. lyrata]|uniref:Predicted protein n=1 Tax=Arabidopsis lyrata subsp. lyrata TaxID=81972 RepID=D7LPC3_ARALL|nr:predicted protein [Arabidopsis lyrata subsp. lyrata]